ncbi:MAG: carboxypeptidase-like regulatory domain-containing protein [Gemmatimonadetes bacterium]|nr:carboxypeptidase-like regulatory domain-containing protein [Gemmatimonadota bacterium]
MFLRASSRQLWRKASRTLALGVAIGLAVPASAHAQIVRGLVVDSVVGMTLVSSTVVLLDASGAEIARTLTDDQGLFLLRAPGAGRYRLRAEKEGYRSSEFPAFDLAADGMVTYQLLVASLNTPPEPPPGETDPETLIDQICEGEDIPGLPVMVGVVVNQETGERVGQADVILTWSTVPSQLVGLVDDLEEQRGAVVAGPNGLYAICGVPVESLIDMHAEFQGMSSEFVDLRFEGNGVNVDGTFAPMEGRLLRHDFELLSMAQRTASISGAVTDTAGRRIANASVRIIGTQYTVRANLFGEFAITGLPPGAMHLTAQVVGYHPTKAQVRLEPGQALELSDDALRMRPVATELDPVTVEAVRPTSRRNLREFERRRSNTTGSFVTRDEFEAYEPRETVDVLRRMRGIRVRSGGDFNLPWVITSSRGARTGGGSLSDGTCFPIIFMDRQYIGNTGNVAVGNAIPIEQVEAIEFYSSIAGLPPEFNRRGATCGVLVFWTR